MTDEPIEGQLRLLLEQKELLEARSHLAREVLRIDGDPYASKYIERFLARTALQENGCWLWKNTLNNKGYARMGMYRRLILMHRWAYLLLKGEIGSGLELDHLCATPSCVNPDHLEPVTHRINNLRGDTIAARNARATHCPKGHPYDKENTSFGKRGGRNCRTCSREKVRPRHEMIKARRTHCPQGHPYDAENTGIGQNGKRYCKACSRIFNPTYHMKKNQGVDHE